MQVKFSKIVRIHDKASTEILRVLLLLHQVLKKYKICFASENYYCLLLMLNLMYNCEIRKATVCYVHYLRSA